MGHLNPLMRGKAAAAPIAPDKAASADPKVDPTSSGNSTTLHDHGDGTYHTDGAGGKQEHPTIGHALMHMAGAHSEGTHMHMHKHPGGITSHHHDSMMGETKGPTEHKDAASAGKEVADVMGDGEASDDPTDSPMGTGHKGGTDLPMF